MNRAQPQHAPARMTREYNRTAALQKVILCPPEKMNPALIASIANSHGLSVADVERMIAERGAPR